MNVIIVFPVFFLLSKSAFKQAVSIPKREGWKRIVTLLVCGGTLISSIFWWIIALVMLIVSLKEQV